MSKPTARKPRPLGRADFAARLDALKADPVAALLVSLADRTANARLGAALRQLAREGRGGVVVATGAKT